MRPDEHDRSVDLVGALGAISRRLRARDLLVSVAVIAPVACLLGLVLRRGGASVLIAARLAGAAAAGALAWAFTRARTRWVAAAAARAIESARPASRNVVVTAEELLRHPERAIDAIRVRVIRESGVIVGSVPAGEVVALARPGMYAAAGIGAGLLLLLGVPQHVARVTARAMTEAVGRVGQAQGTTLAVTIVPPAYTRSATSTRENPDRIDALQGSGLTLHVRGPGAWKVRFGSEELQASRSAEGTSVAMTLSRSGYLAVEAIGGDASASRRLIPVTVAPDRAPTIRIETPGKDLLLPNATPVIGMTAVAFDDFGLRSLELRYTKVSGSGEQFEFKEGSIPLDIARGSARDWKARADVALSKMGLEPGDSMIYRVVGRDERPGDAGESSSETFFIEIAGPGQVALAGFELPPDRERYALSQQMIVLKLERLRAREKGLDRSTLEQEVANLSAEQRAVRANFVFLMGGQVEDEEVEAEHSHEIQEGRLENTARREIIEAIQEMGKVEVGLAAINTGAALPPARAAVEALQRAFGKNRYILRTLPVRSRVDPSRRLTGELSAAADWRRELFPPAPDKALDTARALLGRMLELAPAIAAGTVAAPVLTALAEESLAVDPSADDWQAVSRGLLDLRELRRTANERADALNLVVARVSAVVERAAMAPRPQLKNHSLRSAWSEDRPQ